MPISEAPTNEIPEWATGNYPAGSDSWSATPRRVATAVDTFAAAGLIPNLRTPAQSLNEWFGRVWEWYVFDRGTTATAGAGLLGGLYGDGDDGSATVTGGTTTLTRDMYYTNLTVTSTGILVTAGYRVFVAGTLTVQASGVVHNDGVAAVGHTAGTGAPTGSLLGGSDGGAGVSNASGQNGITGTSQSRALGGSGGAGGDTTSFTGAAGGTAAAPTAAEGGWRHLDAALGSSHLGNQWRAGCGGGSGATENGSGSSGAGGGGGGMLVIHALAIDNQGTIRSNGGDGGTPTSVGDSDELGGGGGGGGGAVYLVHRIAVGGTLGTVQVNGGAAGTGYNGGLNGAAGSSGSIFALVG